MVEDLRNQPRREMGDLYVCSPPPPPPKTTSELTDFTISVPLLFNIARSCQPFPYVSLYQAGCVKLGSTVYTVYGHRCVWVALKNNLSFVNKTKTINSF